MSYEKDLEYLSRELRNAQNIYDEAEKDERESDAEMWMNRVTHLEFQIEVFEKATKFDEYEAKAKAFDEIFKLYIGYEDGWISFPRGSKSFNKEIINVCKSYDSEGNDV